MILTPRGRIITRIYDFRNGGHHINEMETRALYEALWEPICQHRCITYIGDNTAMLHSLKGEHSKGFQLNLHVGRCIAKLYNIGSTLRLFYVPSKMNPADGLTRFRGFTRHDEILTRRIHNWTQRIESVVGGWSAGVDAHS